MGAWQRAARAAVLARSAIRISLRPRNHYRRHSPVGTELLGEVLLGRHSTERVLPAERPRAAKAAAPREPIMAFAAHGRRRLTAAAARAAGAARAAAAARGARRKRAHTQTKLPPTAPLIPPRWRRRRALRGRGVAGMQRAIQSDRAARAEPPPPVRGAAAGGRRAPARPKCENRAKTGRPWRAALPRRRRTRALIALTPTPRVRVPEWAPCARRGAPCHHARGRRAHKEGRARDVGVAIYSCSARARGTLFGAWAIPRWAPARHWGARA